MEIEQGEKFPADCLLLSSLDDAKSNHQECILEYSTINGKTQMIKETIHSFFTRKLDTNEKFYITLPGDINGYESEIVGKISQGMTINAKIPQTLFVHREAKLLSSK